jgi:hypothetical protein
MVDEYSAEEIIFRHQSILSRVILKEITDAHAKHMNSIDIICSSISCEFSWRETDFSFEEWVRHHKDLNLINELQSKSLLYYYDLMKKCDSEYDKVYQGIQNVISKFNQKNMR